MGEKREAGDGEEGENRNVRGDEEEEEGREVRRGRRVEIIGWGFVGTVGGVREEREVLCDRGGVERWDCGVVDREDDMLVGGEGVVGVGLMGGK